MELLFIEEHETQKGFIPSLLPLRYMLHHSRIPGIKGLRAIACALLRQRRKEIDTYWHYDETYFCPLCIGRKSEGKEGRLAAMFPGKNWVMMSDSIYANTIRSRGSGRGGQGGPTQRLNISSSSTNALHGFHRLTVSLFAMHKERMRALEGRCLSLKSSSRVQD